MTTQNRINPPVRQPSQGVRGVIAEAVGEAFDAGRQENQQLVQNFLEPGEQLLAFQRGEQRLPFLIRIMPLVPDVLTAPKIFILAITNRRVLIIRVLKTLFTRKTKGSRLVASIGLADLRAVTPKTGSLTSSLTIETRAGKRFRYSHMLKSAAGNFARDVAMVGNRAN